MKTITNNNNENNLSLDQDDDPTAELELLLEAVSAEIENDNKADADSDDRGTDSAAPDTDPGDANENISSLKSDLESRAETIKELQSELEELRSRWTGLEKEVKVLEELMNNITEELKLALKNQFDTSELLKERDKEIEALRSQLSGNGQVPVSLDRDVGQPRDVDMRDNFKKDPMELSEFIKTLRAEFDAAAETRKQLGQQVEKANAENAILVSELESKKLLSNHYEQGIEELCKSEIPAGGERTTIPASTARADANGKSHETAMLVPLDVNGSSEHPITEGQLSLGSSPDNDIQIESKFVSRHHAQIVNSSTDCILGDLDSTNGTYVNSKRIKRHALRNGDSILIGKHRFKYVTPDLGPNGHESTFDGAGIRS